MRILDGGSTVGQSQGTGPRGESGCRPPTCMRSRPTMKALPWQ